jgi:hypothetical protein
MISAMPLPRAHTLLVTLSLAAAMVAVTAPPASAQATRTWVSGVGDDANPCSRTAPCKTFAGAISKTADGGEIDALDDAGFGAVTITKSITLNGNGHIASSLVSGTNAIVVQADPSDQVVLRGIDLKGISPQEGGCTSPAGLRIVSAASVRLDDVDIAGFNVAVDTPLTLSSSDVFVDISLNNVRIHDNCQYGINVDPAAGHPGRLALDSSTITGSNRALSVAAGGEAWVSNTRVYLNNVGVDQAGGKIHSYCNNQVAGNATDGSFTDNLCVGAPASQAAYCTVPKLKKKTLTQARSALTAAGCTVGKVRKHEAPKKKKGKVLEQAVPPGIQVKAGTAVALVVGK